MKKTLSSKRLLAEKYAVKCAARHPEKWEKIFPDAEWIRADFNCDTSPVFYEKHLRGIDIVINAAGIIRETKNSSFENVHHLGPAALFQAAANLGIKHIIQISALGSDETAVHAPAQSILRRKTSCLRTELKIIYMLYR